MPRPDAPASQRAPRSSSPWGAEKVGVLCACSLDPLRDREGVAVFEFLPPLPPTGVVAPRGLREARGKATLLGEHGPVDPARTAAAAY